MLEFDLKGSSLDASSFIDVVVKDYETIGKDKYVFGKRRIGAIVVVSLFSKCSVKTRGFAAEGL